MEMKTDQSVRENEQETIKIATHCAVTVEDITGQHMTASPCQGELLIPKFQAHFM